MYQAMGPTEISLGAWTTPSLDKPQFPPTSDQGPHLLPSQNVRVIEQCPLRLGIQQRRILSILSVKV